MVGVADAPVQEVDDGGVASKQEPRTRSAGRKRQGLGFLAKQLGVYVVTGCLALVLNFVIPRFMPGDPALLLANRLQQQTGSRPTPEMMARIDALYGDPHKNLLQQFFGYIDHVLHFDFGLSISQYPTPVSYLVLHALPWTTALVGSTTIIAWLIGTALGAWTGWRPGRIFDSGVTMLSTFLHAVPGFWMALLLLSLFSFHFGWLPSGGGYDPNVPYSLGNLWFVLSLVKYSFLPALTLVLLGFSTWQFTMRNVMVTTIAEDYVQYARAKGLTERRVMFGYAARNAMLPNVTGLAHALGGVLGGVVLIETVFTYPGMGYLMTQAVGAKDFPLMQAIFFMLTFAVLVFNFIADAIYVLLDPRTGQGAS